MAGCVPDAAPALRHPFYTSHSDDTERFAKALMELHATIFQSYEEGWTKLVELSWRPKHASDVSP